MSDRHIEYLKLDEIQAEPRNPREHKSIQDVIDSIRRFGFVDPIIYDERTGKMIAGHGRVEALYFLRDKWLNDPEGEWKIPGGITVDGQQQWSAPVVFGWASTDDNEATGLLIALNRHVETGGWNEPGLLQLLNELADSVRGLEGIGFNEDDHAALQRLVEASGEALDAAGEWAAAGMPDYESDGAESAYRTIIHFATDDDADAFFQMLGRDRSTYLWWPESDGQRMTSKEQWVTEDASTDA